MTDQSDEKNDEATSTQLLFDKKDEISKNNGDNAGRIGMAVFELPRC